MNRFATIFVAFGLATAGSTALGEQAKEQVSKQAPKPQPVQMTEAQMDNVAGGALVTAILVDVVDVNNNDVVVKIPVQANVLANVNAAVAVLGEALSVQPLGNQTQSNRR